MPPGEEGIILPKAAKTVTITAAWIGRDKPKAAITKYATRDTIDHIPTSKAKE